MPQRLKVVGYGILTGATFALLVAGLTMPSGMSLWNRAESWIVIMGGPIMSWVWAIRSVPIIELGWLGMCLIPAHPIRPHWATGLLTLIGLVLWFFAGFITIIAAVYGA